MKKFILLSMAAVLFMLCAGCGDAGSDQPTSYVGVFKSVSTSNDKIVMLTITKDDGTLYEGTIDTLPIKGTWGVAESDALGLITNQLNKGADKYFIYFSLDIGGSAISGTAYRQ